MWSFHYFPAVALSCSNGACTRKNTMMIENREYTATAAVENRSEDFTSGHKTKMSIAFTTLLVAIVAVFVDRFVIMRIQRQFSYTEGNSEAGVRFDVVDEEVLSLFVTFDENLDGVLDLSEFIRIANRILRRKVSNRVVIFLIFFFLKLVEIHLWIHAERSQSCVGTREGTEKKIMLS